MSPAEFDFDTPVPRFGTDSAKWHKYHGREIIPLWVADMDFKSPGAVTEALRRRIDHGVFGYGAVLPAVSEAVIDYLERDFDWRVEPNWLVWLPGVVTGLNVACRCVGKQDDAVVTTIPVYPPFLTAPGNSGRRLVTTGMIYSDQRWQFDFDELERTIRNGASMYLLCNPQNPTGTMLGRDELTRLARLCVENEVVICSDEIHCDLVLNRKRRHIPTAVLSDEIAQHTITLMAPSKTYNVPGLGCAFAVIPNHRLRRAFKQAMSGIVPYVNILGLVAAQTAYEHGHHWLEAVKTYLHGNQAMVLQAVNDMEGLHMTPGDATYLAWIDAGGLRAENPCGLFEKAGVGLSNGKDFGGDGYLRLNFACPRPLLAQALERMQQALTAPGPQADNAC